MRDIKGYEGRYAVTADGLVWSYLAQKFLKGYVNSKGYLRVRLSSKEGTEQVFVHRLVAEAYHPIPVTNPDGTKLLGRPVVNHIDGNRQNNSAENLEWCDQSYNMSYAYWVGK